MSEQDRDDQQVPKRATPPDGPARPDVQESTTEESRATASEQTTAREREVSELARRRSTRQGVVGCCTRSAADTCRPAPCCSAGSFGSWRFLAVLLGEGYRLLPIPGRAFH